MDGADVAAAERNAMVWLYGICNFKILKTCIYLTQKFVAIYRRIRRNRRVLNADSVSQTLQRFLVDACQVIVIQSQRSQLVCGYLRELLAIEVLRHSV